MMVLVFSKPTRLPISMEKAFGILTLLKIDLKTANMDLSTSVINVLVAQHSIKGEDIIVWLLWGFLFGSAKDKKNLTDCFDTCLDCLCILFWSSSHYTVSNIKWYTVLIERRNYYSWRGPILVGEETSELWHLFVPDSKSRSKRYCVRILMPIWGTP